MTEQRLFGPWFFLLTVCALVLPSLAQVPEPAQCLVSGIFSLVRLPERQPEKSCWEDCFAEPDCHMAVVEKLVSSTDQCLLVNCLNQGNHSYPRDLSAEIRVYTKSTIHDEKSQFYKEGGYGLANEIIRCSDLMNDSSCQSGSPRFFYNSTSYRCERFFSGCGSSSNTFETQEGCEALCNEKFRCYWPREYGGCRLQIPTFFYNVSSQRCEIFTFSGCGSNGNIFSTVEECERLCGGVKALKPAPTTSQPAVDSAPLTSVPSATDLKPAPTTSQSAVNSATRHWTAVLTSIPVTVALIITVAVVLLLVRHCEQSQLQPSISRDRSHSYTQVQALLGSDEERLEPCSSLDNSEV
ncbi:uncharacterized protein [Trachinotus anak]|uniref:uncharacterized protein isoform X3 n=1 Tax=Trachinotus anak TaxID=443729 RepID=UPI0039F2625D